MFGVRERLRIQRRGASRRVVGPSPEQPGVRPGCPPDAHAIDLVGDSFHTPAVDETPGPIAHLAATRLVTGQAAYQTSQHVNGEFPCGAAIDSHPRGRQPRGVAILIVGDAHDYRRPTQRTAFP